MDEVNPLRSLTKNQSEILDRLKGRLQMVRRKMKREQGRRDQSIITSQEFAEIIAHLRQQESRILKKMSDMQDR